MASPCLGLLRLRHLALCAGFLFNINPLINFWVGSAFGLGMLLVYAFWVPAEQKEELKKETDPNAAPTNPSLKEMVAVLKMPTCGCSSSSCC